MTNQALKPAWAGRTMRLDPFRLPQASSFADTDECGAVVALPARAFSGVAARAIEDDEGNVTVTLELHHADPMLSVPLLVASDLEDVAVDWRAWAEAFALPMLLIESDGVARTLEESLSTATKNAAALARRQGRPTHSRRPRFLARRRVGQLGLRLVINGEEIIAPE